MWNSVEAFPPQTPLFALHEALRSWSSDIRLLQCGEDNFSLIVPTRLLKAAAGQSENLEIGNLTEEATPIVFLSAHPAAIRDLLLMLEQEEIEPHSSWLLAATNAASLSDPTIPAGLSIQSINGTVSVRTAEGKSEFSLYLISKQPAPASPRFEPVKPPIGEGSGNLRQRAEWFKRRSGR
jgi:hypothetical protein